MTSGSATRWDPCRKDNYWRVLGMTSWYRMRQLRVTHSWICYLPASKIYYWMWLINGTFGCSCHETVVFKALREVRIESSRIEIPWVQILAYSGHWSVGSHGRQTCIKVALKGVRLLDTVLSKCRNRKKYKCSKRVVQPAKDIIVGLWC